MRLRGVARTLIASTVGALAFAAFLPSAAAEWKLGGEARGEFMCCFIQRPFGGGGLEMSLGYSLDTYPILIVPEIAVEGGVYAPGPITGSLRAVGGLRIGVTAVVEPSLYVRGGYAGLFGRSIPEHGGTLEIGAALDKRLEREITVGGSLGYQSFFIPRAAHGFIAGVHVGLWL